jgi:hypothetical protein
MHEKEWVGVEFPDIFNLVISTLAYCLLVGQLFLYTFGGLICKIGKLKTN